MANSIAALCHDSATDRGSIAKCLQDAYDRNFSAFISGKASGLDTAYAAQFLYQRFGFDGRLVWHCKNSNIYGPSPDKTHYWEGERNPRKKRFKRRLRNPR